MQSRLIVRRGAVPGDRVAAISAAAFEVAKKRAELWIVEPTASATMFGAYQPTAAPRRASGGAEVALGPGTLHVMLALPSLAMLELARPAVILNRAVRPLLRALTRKGALAHYFGRDWISAAGRPIALVSFAHEAATQRTLVEVSVSVSQSCISRARASYRGAAPATLEELGGPISVSEVADRVSRAVLDAYGLAPEARDLPDDAELAAAPTFAARPTLTNVHEDAIGPIGVGPDADGTLRFGGELMASFDALAALETSLREIDRADVAAIQAAVERALARPEVALFGVRAIDAFVELVHAPGAQ